MPDIEVHVVAGIQKPMVSSPDELAGNIWLPDLLGAHVPGQ